jgi:hypothetical protein
MPRSCWGDCVDSLDLAGVGIWSERFASWDQFSAVIRGESVDMTSQAQAKLIPPRDRRRAPTFVRMAVEVMDQACRMGRVDPSSVATVFGSSLGDLEITDYMCSALAREPLSMSPTRFHNSVHNACAGYWSIATGSHWPANAISAYDHSSAVALLEGAVLVIEERIPVVVTFQEARATHTFESIFPSRRPLSIAMLLTQTSVCERPLGTLSLALERDSTSTGLPVTPRLPEFAGNFTASMLDMLIAAAERSDYSGSFRISRSSTLAAQFSPSQPARSRRDELPR